jgi:hypothetical protein
MVGNHLRSPSIGFFCCSRCLLQQQAQRLLEPSHSRQPRSQCVSLRGVPFESGGNACCETLFLPATAVQAVPASIACWVPATARACYTEFIQQAQSLLEPSQQASSDPEKYCNIDIGSRNTTESEGMGAGGGRGGAQHTRQLSTDFDDLAGCWTLNEARDTRALLHATCSTSS